MAWFFLVVAIVFIIAPFIQQDEDLWIMGPILALVFGYRSYKNFRAIETIHDDDKLYQPPAHSSNQEKIIYYQRVLWLGLVAFAGLTVIIILDLNQLESGEVEHIRVVEPVAFIYRVAGYWPAVLVTPLLGGLMYVAMHRKLKKMKQEENGQ